MLLLALALAATDASRAVDLPPLFRDEREALIFAETFGPAWRNPRLVMTDDRGVLFGFKTRLFDFRLDKLKGQVAIGTGPTGKIGFYEVRFPSVATKCVGTPATQALARSLLTRFEPTHAGNSYNVNRVAARPSWSGPIGPFPAVHPLSSARP